jgi:hypothetical protein
VTRCTSAISRSSAEAVRTDTAAKLAAACTPTVSPGCSASGRNICATPSDSEAYEDRSTARMSTLGSEAAKASSENRGPNSDATMSASGNSLDCARIRVHTMDSASGSRAQRSTIASVATGSAAMRSAPSRCDSRSTASSRLSRSRLIGRAPVAATTASRRPRLVTTTSERDRPGNSGSTWADSRALSSSSRQRRSASRLRYRPSRAAGSVGTCAAGTPSASRKSRTVSFGSTTTGS